MYLRYDIVSYSLVGKDTLLVAVCRLCGSSVMDKRKHDEWHAQLPVEANRYSDGWT